MKHDLIIKDGLWFDGLGSPGAVRSIGIRGGRVETISEAPIDDEMQKMETLLGDALDAGFLGLSTMTNPWDKLDGDRYRSKSLPSTFATWGEYRRLHALLRERSKVLQSAPNLTAPANAVLFF